MDMKVLLAIVGVLALCGLVYSFRRMDRMLDDEADLYRWS